MRTVRPIRAFNDNYIWLLETDGGQAVVVDPGDASPVAAELASKGLSLSAILVTHHHFDHTGGVAELASAWGCPVYGPENPSIEAITHHVVAGDKVKVPGYCFDVLAVPGHTLDHIAYFQAGDEPLVFCGDTLFAGGCGRVFEGTYPMMFESLQRLAVLPENTRVYCAHEYTRANLAFAREVEPDNPDISERIAQVDALRDDKQPTVPSLLATELATNPFLRCSQESVIRGLATSGRPADPSPAGRFAELRQWKDTFR